MAPVSRLTHHLGVTSRPRALRTSSLRMQDGEKEEELVQISRDELKELAEAAGITVKTTTEPKTENAIDTSGLRGIWLASETSIERN